MIQITPQQTILVVIEPVDHISIIVFYSLPA